jgi:hypothetical protein
MLALAALLGALTLFGIAFLVLRRLRNIAPDDTGVGSEISLERYAAFPRLMSSADLEFLAAQPGYEPAIGRNLKRAHARATRLYLREMRADFSRLCRAARAIARTSETDRSDLVTTVHREQFVFYWRMLGVQTRVALSAFGLPVPALPSLAESLARIQSAIEPPRFPISQF